MTDIAAIYNRIWWICGGVGFLLLGGFLAAIWVHLTGGKSP